jgi:3-deoxy-D-manno-octulosonic-acid transferase
MKKFWQIIYYFIITPLLVSAFFVASFFSAKIRKGFYPRFSTIRRLKQWIKNQQPQGQKILFHAASFGEFEHIRPVLQMLKEQFHTVNIVTFFSPSGFEHAGKAEGLDFHLYMPIDRPRNWRKIYEVIKPSLIVVAKWDVWPAQVWTAKAMNISIYLINASLREDSSRVKRGIKQFLKYVFGDYNVIYTVSVEDGQRLLYHYPGCHVEVVGDTKYDQVVLRKKKAQSQNLLPQHWLKDHFIFIAGSIWPEDETHLFPAIKKLLEQKHDMHLVLVPHQPEQKSIENIQRNFESYGVQKFSFLDKLRFERIIVVDAIGYLAGLYHHAHLAYVGGSFRQGIHNVVEPAVFGIPVLFGPVHENSYEAIQLSKNNGGIVVKNDKMIFETIKSLIEDQSQRKFLGKKAESFALRNTGTTTRLMKNWNHLLGSSHTR